MKLSNFYMDSEIEKEVLTEYKNYRKIKARGGGIMMVEVYFENGAVGAPHTHVHEQTTYCLEGEFEFNIGGEINTIRVGDSIFMLSEILHGCVLKSDRGRLLDVFTPQREDFLK